MTEVLLLGVLVPLVWRVLLRDTGVVLGSADTSTETRVCCQEASAIRCFFRFTNSSWFSAARTRDDTGFIFFDDSSEDCDGGTVMIAGFVRGIGLKAS